MCKSNIFIQEDFNIPPTNPIMTTFMQDNNFANIIKSNTCFITPYGRCMDLILTSKPERFQNTGVIETGVSVRCLF